MTEPARTDIERENDRAPQPESVGDLAADRSTLSSATPAEESVPRALEDLPRFADEREAALARTEVAEAPVPPFLSPALEFPDESRVQERPVRSSMYEDDDAELSATTVPAPRCSDAYGPVSMGDPSGAVLGGAFRIRERLGRGAIGQVWLADDLKLGRPVAVKLVALDQLDELEARRVTQEAHLTARIQHRNVVTVFDTGRQQQVFYLAMELLEGEDLGSFLSEQGSLPPEEAVRILLPALNGMAAAHSRGVIHRDFKPENIFLVHDEGRMIPKVVDFGVALAADQPASTRLTHSGLLVGTPLYMAPEQLGSFRALDERVDVWAATAVLYEMLTGSPPYAHEKTITELVARIASPDPVPLYPMPDERLRQILERGLQKERENRWPSIRHLGTALAQWLQDQGIREDISGESLSTNWLRDSSPALCLPSTGPLARMDLLARHGCQWVHTKNNRKKVWIAAAAMVLMGAPTMFDHLTTAFAVPSLLQSEAAPVQEVGSGPAILAAQEDALSPVPAGVVDRRGSAPPRAADEDQSAVDSVSPAFYAEPTAVSPKERSSAAAKKKRRTVSSDPTAGETSATPSERPVWRSPETKDKIDPRWGF